MAFCSSAAALETDPKADLTEQGFGAAARHAERIPDIFTIVIETVTLLSSPIPCFSISGIRAQMLKHLRFCPLVNSSGLNPSCSWPDQDRYVRFGCEFASDAPIIWFAPLPPIFTDLNQCPRLPAAHPETYTLVLDLDETLVHHSVINGSGFVGFRPGVAEFLRHTSLLGYELVVYTAATQDYADACIDMVDPDHLVRHRLYRQHALSWGPVFVKDLSRIGRDLDRTLIIDNIRENFMLQPHNGIFIYTWLDDPQDTALSDLVPVLDEIIMTRSSVPSVLTKYREQIPEWAGWKTSLLQAGAAFNHSNDAGNSSAAV
jgi:Dullard-like phosphatase family protein